MQTESTLNSTPGLSPASDVIVGAADKSSVITSLPVKLSITTSPWFTIFFLMVTDMGVLCASVALGTFAKWIFAPTLIVELYLNLWPCLGMFVIAYAIAKLYPVAGMSPAEELRRTTIATTIVFALMATMSVLFKETEAYSRAVLLVSWAVALILVPVNRALMRTFFASRPWWGNPAVVLGAGKTGNMLVRKLQRQPGLGLKPVAVLDDDPEKLGMVCGLAEGPVKPDATHVGVPVIGSLKLAPVLARELKIPYAIVAMPGVSHECLLELLEKYGDSFPHLLVIPDLFGFSSLRVPSKDLGGVLGLEVRQQLLLSGPRFTKRMIDLVLTVVGGIAILPFILLIALLIRLESSGPAFYGHERIGRGRRKFKAWKFRSMHRNADKLLHDYLEKHPELKEAWERDHKLKDDPRVTRMGNILRKTSLDELPQLWNVLMGEMSLVGPRPIVEEEVARYDKHFSLYLKVRPGMTGLWQVSGRNDTTYAERVQLDTYYVRNWSVWLDLHILACTLPVVVLRKGAY